MGLVYSSLFMPVYSATGVPEEAGLFWRFFHPSFTTCRARPSASEFGGTSSVITLPAAIIQTARDLHRRHQRRIAFHECAVANARRVLLDDLTYCVTSAM